MIKAQKLVKKFKSGESELVVLKGLDFHVQKGEFVSIIGRSGSGKSTLLYQLGLLDHPNSGQIIIDGVDVSELSDKERTAFRLNELGYIFQDYALIPELTAIENVLIPLYMQGLKNHEAESQAILALEKVGLKEKFSNLPSQLSGGEQQRVSIARAISHEPKILFADEPTANLDSETKAELISVMRKLNEEQGITFLFSTHDDAILAAARRVIRLKDGHIEADERR